MQPWELSPEISILFKIISHNTNTYCCSTWYNFYFDVINCIWFTSLILELIDCTLYSDISLYYFNKHCVLCISIVYFSKSITPFQLNMLSFSLVICCSFPYFIMSCQKSLCHVWKPLFFLWGWRAVLYQLSLYAVHFHYAM